MYWPVYLFASFLISHLIAKTRSNNYSLIFILVSVFLITPAQIKASEEDLAPAIFIFIFNILFEEDFSLRVLRPLILTIPMSLTFILFSFLIKRRFF